MTTNNTSSTTHTIYYHLFDITEVDIGNMTWNYFNTITDDLPLALSQQQILEYEEGIPCYIEIEVVQTDSQDGFCFYDEYISKETWE